jgi:hypothetical protein
MFTSLASPLDSASDWRREVVAGDDGGGKRCGGGEGCAGGGVRR